MLRVLIVEDNEDNLRLVSRRLKAAGWSVLEATTAESALTQLKALSSNLPIDVILLDLQLPDRDGVSLIPDIRALHLTPVPTLVACTASAMHGDREKALAAGFDGYLTKPVDTRRLADQLQELHHARRH